MEEYRMIYKCRLCSKVFEYCTTGTAIANMVAVRLETGDNFRQGNTFGYRHISHLCEDGSLGFADYQGLRKVK